MAKFEVTLGEEFEVGGVEVEDVAEVTALAEIDQVRRMARHRARLAYIVLAVFVVAMIVATLLGYADGTMDEVAAVWSHGSIFVGLVLGWYFKKD
jgi:hypothetical protein